MYRDLRTHEARDGGDGMIVWYVTDGPYDRSDAV